MSTQQRVVADKLHRIIEGMLYIAVKGLHDSPRREDNRIAFMDVFEEIAALSDQHGAKAAGSDNPKV